MAASRKPPRNKQLKIALLDSVTHELRTPLTSIKASVTALLTNSEIPLRQRNELLIVINEEADRLNKLVDEAVKVTQSSGPVKFNLTSHPMRQLLMPRGQFAGGYWAGVRSRSCYQQDCHPFAPI
jgi:K+-sensing histidine kinase KdpD